MSSAMKLSSNDLQSSKTRQNYTACIVGCGRTGLVTAGLFIEAGFKVIGVDSSSHIIHQLQKGVSPFTENDLSKFIEPKIKNKNFISTTNLRKAVSQSNIIVVGVSASLDSKKKPDYSRFEKTCKDIGMSLTSGSLVMLQNTMGPGMTKTVVQEILENASGLKAGEQFGLAYFSTLNNSSNPSDNVHNGTKIVGGTTKRSLNVACMILQTITKSHIIPVKDIKIAEAVKLLEEAYKEVNIAFANEFAKFCEKAEIDFVTVRDLINPIKFSGMAGLHNPRNSHILVNEAEALDVKLRMLSLSTKINDETLDHAIRLTREALRTTKKNLRRSKIAVFGVSTLPDRKKVAHSATKKLVKQLKKMGVTVKVYDPFFTANELTSMNYDTEKTMSQTVEGADCIVVAVGHERFSRLNLRRLQLLMKHPSAIVDMSQVIDPKKAEKAGFVYRGFGRGIWTK
jgi:UDP-N-acetyl-D-mannosaminuronic acid dehydrogenase